MTDHVPPENRNQLQKTPAKAVMLGQQPVPDRTEIAARAKKNALTFF
jgi:hypothetical protein